MDYAMVSAVIYILGGILALGSGDPRIAASVTTVAYIILLLGGNA